MSKIFIINPAGNIQSLNNAYVKTYAQLEAMVDMIFPPRDALRVERNWQMAQAQSQTPARLAEITQRQRNAQLTAEAVMMQLHAAEAEMFPDSAASAAAGAGASAGSSSIGALAVPHPISHSLVAPHAKLFPSTDADVNFNSFAYWRDEIAPLKRADDEAEDADEEEEAGRRTGPMPPLHLPEQRITVEEPSSSPESASVAAAVPPSPATMAEEEKQQESAPASWAATVDRAATAPTSAAVAAALTDTNVSNAVFAAAVHQQVREGEAEANEQAAAAEAIVEEESMKELQHKNSNK